MVIERRVIFNSGFIPGEQIIQNRFRTVFLHGNGVKRLVNIRQIMRVGITDNVAVLQVRIQLQNFMATCGIASGARPVLKTLSDAVQEKQLKDISVTQTGCIGLCQYEPIVEVFEPGKEKITYVHMNPEKALDVVNKHLIGGHPVTAYMLQAHEA